MAKFIDKDLLIHSLTKEDIITICANLGCAEYKEDRHGNLCFSTMLCHGGDSPFKLIYYANDESDKSSLFHCFTCGETYDVIELVMRSKRLQGRNSSYYTALRYVAQVTNKLELTETDVLDTPVKRIDDWSWIGKFKRLKQTERELPTLTPINEDVLDMFYYIPHEEFLNAGISREVLAEFEIGYWGKTNQIVIPHRDWNFNLIGVRGRFLDQEDVKNIGKYVPLFIEEKSLSHPLGSNLYGIHINQEKIKKCKKVMLLESEKGVMQNHTFFGEDDFSLAVCGSELTDNQIKILLHHLRVEEVILAYDKEFYDDDEIQQNIYRNILFKKAALLLPYFKVSLLWDEFGLLDYKDAPTDKGKEVLLKLLDNKKTITSKDLEVLNDVC